ncbi:hypothetical protein BRADO4949 [Bradyrhizobium sp. ORS 278]|nr:hypothetical protein BRADO4949 [Bradyrhizobium sp. ORS 278]
MAGNHLDNETPKSFLRSVIAERLFEHLGSHARVDRLFTAIALELGTPLDKELIGFLGGHHADVALYDGDRPSTLLQLDIFDSASHLPPGSAALDRADFFARTQKLHASVGIMICPFVVPLEARIERLHDLLGGNMYVGERQASQDGTWQWCFACASLGTARRAP